MWKSSNVPGEAPAEVTDYDRLVKAAELGRLLTEEALALGDVVMTENSFNVYQQATGEIVMMLRRAADGLSSPSHE